MCRLSVLALCHSAMHLETCRPRAVLPNRKHQALLSGGSKPANPDGQSPIQQANNLMNNSIHPIESRAHMPLRKPYTQLCRHHIRPSKNLQKLKDSSSVLRSCCSGTSGSSPCSAGAGPREEGMPKRPGLKTGESHDVHHGHSWRGDVQND